MKSSLYTLIFSLILSCLSFVVHSQEITLEQTNHSGIYGKGQKIIVEAMAKNQAGDTLHIRVYKNNNQLFEQKNIIINKDSLIVYEGSFEDPCSIIVEAITKRGNASLGMLVDPEKLQPGAKCPEDFDVYWDKLKKSLNALPLDAKTTTIKDSQTEKGFSCVDIEINCLGPKPARGYFAKPENASPKSLPIVLLVHAAGVKGSWCRSEPKNALNYAKMGSLCFDLNAHGMLNGQPAGLDHRVSAVVAIVPAMCDWIASLSGRMGWPQPFETDALKEEMLNILPYFDAANILRGSETTIFTEIGLIDMTCPATSVYSAINQAKGDKIIFAVPYRPHHQPQNEMAKTWEEDVYKPRELFIRNYLSSGFAAFFCH